MDTFSISDFGLLELREAIRSQRVKRRFRCLLEQQLKTSERRQALRKAANFLDESAQAFVECVVRKSSECLNHSNDKQLESLKATLDCDRASFSRVAEVMSQTDMGLGRMESDLMGSIQNIVDLVESVITRLSGNKEAVARDDSSLSLRFSMTSTSSDDVETMHPELHRYFNRAATASAIKEQIDGLYIHKRTVLSRREFLLDQDRELPDFDVDFEYNFDTKIHYLNQELLKAERSREGLAEECSRLGIDVQKARWRNNSITMTKASSGKSHSDIRFNQWLQHLNGSDIALGSYERSCMIDPVESNAQQQESQGRVPLSKSGQTYCSRNDGYSSRTSLKLAEITVQSERRDVGFTVLGQSEVASHKGAKQDSSGVHGTSPQPLDSTASCSSTFSPALDMFNRIAANVVPDARHDIDGTTIENHNSTKRRFSDANPIIHKSMEPVFDGRGPWQRSVGKLQSRAGIDGGKTRPLSNVHLSWGTVRINELIH